MTSSVIVLVSDRPDRSEALAGALLAAAECEVVGTDETWTGDRALLGVVADVTLSRPETVRCLRALQVKYTGLNLPLVCLMRRVTSDALTQAKTLGATACPPSTTPPHAIVKALFAQIKPGETVTDRLVSRNVNRAGAALEGMFAAVGAGGRFDMKAAEAGLDPVLSAMQEGGLDRWLDTVWTYDNATYQHCLLVAGFAARFALHLGFRPADCRLFVRAALVHDVGKARIPHAILNKPGRLDPDELAVMRTHAAIGFDILRAGGECDAVTLGAARHHHELLDGSGYPDGLSGDAIGDLVRLLTICDIYAALTEQRSYKAPMPATEALGILRGMKDKLEDRLVDTFGTAVAKAA